MATASGSYQQTGPQSPQTARKVLFAPANQIAGFGDVPAALVQNGLRVQAIASGSGGEAITVAFTADAANTPLSVTAVGNAITVHLQTDAGNNPTSTAAQVRDAINTTLASNALVTSAVVSGDGTQVVTALAATALAGDTTQGKGQLGNAPLPRQVPIKNTYT